MRLRTTSVTALALAGLVFLGLAVAHAPAHTRAQSTYADTPIAAAPTLPTVQVETLLQAESSGEGVPYQGYPTGQPELTVVKLTIPPHTALPWQTSAMPKSAYVVSGQIKVVRQVDGLTRTLGAGQVLAEMADIPHRGGTADEPAVLIVFYDGSGGAPLNEVVHHSGG